MSGETPLPPTTPGEATITVPGADPGLVVLGRLLDVVAPAGRERQGVTWGAEGAAAARGDGADAAGRRDFWVQGMRLRLHISAGPAFGTTVRRRAVVTLRTPVLDSVSAPPAVVRRTLALLNRDTTGSAWRYDEGERAVELVLQRVVSSLSAHDRADELWVLAALQLTEGELEAAGLARRLGGRVAPALRSPASPPFVRAAIRCTVDEVRQSGREPSRFGETRETAMIAGLLRDASLALRPTVSPGLAFEVPADGSRSILVTMATIGTHAWLGDGLQLRTLLPPLALGGRLPSDVAARLDSVQRALAEPVVSPGAWTFLEREHHPLLCWTRFVPNALYSPGALLELAADEAERARWLASLLDGSR